jgi:hypothetical protein
MFIYISLLAPAHSSKNCVPALIEKNQLSDCSPAQLRIKNNANHTVADTIVLSSNLPKVNAPSHPRNAWRRNLLATKPNQDHPSSNSLLNSVVHNFRDGCRRNSRKSSPLELRDMKHTQHEVIEVSDHGTKLDDAPVRLPVFGLLPSRSRRDAQDRRRLLRPCAPRDIRAPNFGRDDAPTQGALREVGGKR